MTTVTSLKSALLTQPQKNILEESLLFYTNELQVRYYALKLIDTVQYLEMMKQIDEIRELLHLR